MNNFDPDILKRTQKRHLTQPEQRAMDRAVRKTFRMTEDTDPIAAAEHRRVILTATYIPSTDQLVFATPWGTRVAPRSAIEEFRDVDPALFVRIYVSETGIHLDEADIDINSAELLAGLFPEMRRDLGNSF